MMTRQDFCHVILPCFGPYTLISKSPDITSQQIVVPMTRDLGVQQHRA
jgi:hypothetical protein